MPTNQNPGTVDANLATTVVRCPVSTCNATERFTETDHTLRNEEQARETRENYLRARHNSGQHYSRG